MGKIKLRTTEGPARQGHEEGHRDPRTRRLKTGYIVGRGVSTLAIMTTTPQPP